MSFFFFFPSLAFYLELEYPPSLLVSIQSELGDPAFWKGLGRNKDMSGVGCASGEGSGRWVLVGGSGAPCPLVTVCPAH